MGVVAFVHPQLARLDDLVTHGIAGRMTEDDLVAELIKNSIVSVVFAKPREDKSKNLLSVGEKGEGLNLFP